MLFDIIDCIKKTAAYPTTYKRDGIEQNDFFTMGTIGFGYYNRSRFR
jgi:hypothetical protein